MTKKNTALATGIVTGASLIAVGAHSGAPEPRVFLYERHGLAIEKDPKAKHETKKNGAVHQKETVKVKLKGLGTRKLIGEVDDQPVAEGGAQTTVIIDPKANTTMVFGYTPKANAITIADGTGDDAHRVTVTQNPDHRYTVDGVPAADGKAAVALLRKKEAYKAASPHSMMLAWAYGHAPTAATKNTQNCDLPFCCDSSSPNGEKGWGELAEPLAVCSLFSDLCTCVACDKAGGDACDVCK